MVVAEVPLWVFHNNSSGTSTTAKESDADPSRSQRVAISTWDKTDSKGSNSSINSARDALQLLGSGGLGSNKTHSNNATTITALRSTKKCAIYSIDIHPEGRIFATAGGDGTVRLWNVRALFANYATNDNSTMDKSRNAKKTSHFDAQTGAYVSSESSGSECNNYDPRHTSHEKSVHTNGHYNNNTDLTHLPDEDDASSFETPPLPAIQVHDLNAVVRRKKDGSSIPSLAVKQQEQAPTVPLALPKLVTAPSPTSNKRGKNSKSVSTPFHPSHHRLLCTLSAHTGSSVLAVRFSTSGQFLASAGDDSCVCIYTKSSAAKSSLMLSGNLVPHDEKTVVEQWSRIKLCRGHNLDVVDLAWAPDDSHLVSCSLDSATPIIVWKMTNLVSDLSNNGKNGASKSMICNPFKILGQSIHTSAVKGVAFDPAGSYMATSGDDPAVCIWRAHDDWGLEKRIDADAGIFRSWAGKEDNVQALSSQSMFRRISWSTDGAFICSTNSVVKNKHVASTISREGWSVSGASGQTTGAANLVGHKQPVVVCRHSAQMLNARKRRRHPENSEDGSNEEKALHHSEEFEQDEPEHGTLLALGDRRGFVTVWSTRKSRPIFKVQCSESHCTVTDLAWGALCNGDLLLLVSVLDGQVIALRFAVPDEIGVLLTEKEKARVFQIRYGIDMEDFDGVGGLGQRRLLVGGSSRPKLIENALQMTLEENQNIDEEDSVEIATKVAPPSNKEGQQETISLSGKKRIRPVSMQLDDDDDSKNAPAKRFKDLQQQQTQARKQVNSNLDPLQSALEIAEKAATAAENGNSAKKGPRRNDVDNAARAKQKPSENAQPHSPTKGRERHVQIIPSSVSTTAIIPFSVDRLLCTELPLPTSFAANPISREDHKSSFMAECVNTTRVPIGSKGGAVACVNISISHNGRVSWRDQILGTSCSAVAASRDIFAVGTVDGTIQLFGTSPTLGWSSTNGFRSHAPLIFGRPIVSLQLKEFGTSDEQRLDMLVVTADGGFGVWTVVPEFCMQYKGSLVPALSHMSLSLSSVEDERFPKLSRIQITDFGHLLMILSFESSPSSRQSSVERATSSSILPLTDGPGGSVQAFVYDRKAELWLRVSDSRFMLSDFYSALPIASRSTEDSQKMLSTVDDAVRIGSLQSSLRDVQRGRVSDRHADGIYHQGEEESGNYLPSRAHCEDRIACAVALHSVADFRFWLTCLVRTFASRGLTTQLRMLIDMLLGQMSSSTPSLSSSSALTSDGCWWLSRAPTILHEDRRALVKSVVIPEMSKNRELQRMTNEISLEVDNQIG